MIYFHVSVAYTLINLVLAILIFVKSRRNVLSQFYAFCVLCLIALGVLGYFLTDPTRDLPFKLMEQATAFLFSVFPFFFLHFMLIFVRRYEILNSRTAIIANYFAGMFSYAVVLMGFIPNPFAASPTVSVIGYTYYITWMSILFSIGVALLYSLIGGFAERGIQSNLMFIAFALLMLLLPTPFTLSLFSKFSDNSTNLYFISSTGALTIAVYIVFRHRITMNTPYQAMKSALATMNDILFKTNRDFKIEMMQGAVLPLLGYQEQELQGRSIEEMIYNDTFLKEYRASTPRNRGKETFFDAEVICRDGNRLPMEFSLTPVWTNEEIAGFVGVGRNITKRRRAEKALQESEARYRSLFDNNPHPMWVYDRETFRILVVNDAAIEHYGYTRNQFMNITMSDVLSPEQAQEFQKVESASSEALLVTAWRHRLQNGTTIDVEMTSHLLDFGGRPARLVLNNDVTERKKAEVALRASEERYRKFFEDDLTGDVTVQPDGRITACNPAFARIFGFASVDDAMTRNMSDLFPNPAAYQAFGKMLKDEGKLEYYECELVRIDGQPVYVVENVIGAFDERGTLVETKCYVFDNTERKRLEDQLRQSQKMENLGTMAAGIAHDFNNTLAIILANASLLKGGKFKPEVQESSVDRIQKAVERAAGMVRQLMTFARKSETIFVTLNMNEAINGIVTMLKSTFPKTLEITSSLEDGIPNITADPSQVHQVLLNLCVNARDAIMQGGDEDMPKGKITISSRTERGSRVQELFHDAKAERYVVVSVADTGMGMSETTMQHIYEPFFTTKGAGKGTGLGLAVVYGVVKGHRGFIDLSSTVGQGTTFSLYFPISETEAQVREGKQEVEEQTEGGGKTILLVEDEEMLLDSLKVLLEAKGYHVLIARDGEEAVDVYLSHQNEIAFVLADMGLPKMGGWEAFQHMKKANPKVKVAFGSGHIDPTFKAKMMSAGAVDFIQKPYIPQEVLKRIHHMIYN